MNFVNAGQAIQGTCLGQQMQGGGGGGPYGWKSSWLLLWD